MDERRNAARIRGVPALIAHPKDVDIRRTRGEPAAGLPTSSATVIVMDPVMAACRVPALGQGGASRGIDGSSPMRQMPWFVTVAVAIAVFAAAGCSVAPGRERANEAWSQRLTQQSESIQAQAARQERSEEAWSARLSEQAHAYVAEQVRALRANNAWSLRLTKLADHPKGGGISADRASQAWSDRLNGLAGSSGVVD